MRELEIFKERAKTFFETSKILYEKEKYDNAIFNLEQSAQLYLKYLIAKKTGDFPKTHSLTNLLRGLSKVYEKEKEVKEFIENYANELSVLESSYINSRYIPFVYEKEVLDKQLIFFERLLKFLESITNERFY